MLWVGLLVDGRGLGAANPAILVLASLVLVNLGHFRQQEVGVGLLSVRRTQRQHLGCLEWSALP